MISSSIIIKLLIGGGATLGIVYKINQYINQQNDSSSQKSNTSKFEKSGQYELKETPMSTEKTLHNQARREQERREQERREQERREQERQEQERQEQERREQERQEQERREQERQLKNQLVDEYCDILKKIALNRAAVIYRKTFVRCAPVCQTLLGLHQRFKQREQLPEDDIEVELGIQIEMARLSDILAPNGFTVKVVPSKIDLGNKREECLTWSIADLKLKIQNQRKTLKRETSPLNFEEYLVSIGKELYKLTEAFVQKDIVTCLKMAEPIKEALKKKGCFMLFASDFSNPERRREYFYVEPDNTTELPGMFYKSKSGELLVINTLLGTRHK